MTSQGESFDGPQVGDVIEGYEVIEPLGAGGMGRVYKVRNTISNRVDAMKVLLPDLEGNPGLTARFLSEIQVLGGLNHPNIAALYTALRVGNRFVMILELVEGEPLSAKIKERALTPEQAMHYTCQVLDAIGYAHQKGVIHRDIKPGNILITAGGVVKLVDFGIAKTSLSPALTATGAAVGSAFYMSPEQVLGRPLDCRSDLYSIGITLYEMVTGVRPIRGDTEYTIMDGHLHQVPPPAHTVNSAVPPALSGAIAKALAKEPGERFQTAAEFLAAVRDIRAGRISSPEAKPVAASESLTPARQAAPARRRPLWIVASLGVGLIFLFAAIALLVLRQSPPPVSDQALAPAQTPTQPPAAPATAVIPPSNPPAAAEATPVPAPPAATPSAPVKLPETKPAEAKTSPAHAEADKDILLAKPVEHGMESWAPGAWRNDAGWFVHRGGDYLLYPLTPTRGRFEFSALKRHGKRIRWVLRFQNPRNYLLFEIDSKTFSRKEVADGRTTAMEEAAINAGDQVFTMQIDVRPDVITHRLFANGAWKLIDEWRQPGLVFDSGSFGFDLGKDDEIGLSNFRFAAQPAVPGQPAK